MCAQIVTSRLFSRPPAANITLVPLRRGLFVNWRRPPVPSSLDHHYKTHWCLFGNASGGFEKHSPEAYVAAGRIQFREGVTRTKLQVYRAAEIEAPVSPFLRVGRRLIGVGHTRKSWLTLPDSNGGFAPPQEHYQSLYEWTCTTALRTCSRPVSNGYSVRRSICQQARG